MNDAQRADQVDEFVQPFPVFSQAAHGPFGGGGRQRNEEQVSGEPYQDIRLLKNAIYDERPIQPIIQPDKGQ